MKIIPDKLLGYEGRLKRFRPIIEKAFVAKGLPLSWGLAIARQESGFRPWASNTRDPGDKRRGGSWGLFQMSLLTAQKLAFTGDAFDLLDPERNAEYAARLVAELRDRWHNLQDVAAAYNSGKSYLLAPASTRLVYCPNVIKYSNEFAEMFG